MGEIDSGHRVVRNNGNGVVLATPNENLNNFHNIPTTFTIFIFNGFHEYPNILKGNSNAMNFELFFKRFKQLRGFDDFWNKEP